MNKEKLLKTVILAAAMAFCAGTPASAFDPTIHSSDSVGSTVYGTWGQNYTCGTCHKSSLSGGNAKGIASTVNSRQVIFDTYLSYGEDTGHTTSAKICEVCHTLTAHHRYDNSTNGANHHNTVDCTGCHLHSKGFKKGLSESKGGTACDTCHSDLYVNTYGWGMHSQTPNMSYRHYMDNALTGNDPQLNGNRVGVSFYSTDLPNKGGAEAVNPKARRCLMCHVDHDLFNDKRAFNLRANASALPSGGVNRDDTLCLSCHMNDRTKAYTGPNKETRTVQIPFPNVSYDNATSILNFSTHGYPVVTNFSDNSYFSAICSKCHNDSIGKNGETPKSFVGTMGYGQKGTFKFGEHNSTLPGRFAVFSTDFYQRTAGNATLIPKQATMGIQISPSPGWVTDIFQGHYLVVTAGGGSNKRSVITGNTADTITVQTWPDGITNGSSFDITDDNISVDNTCFSCHSKSGEWKSTDTLQDWYGQKSMTDKLAGIFDLFTGDMGTMPGNIRNKNTGVIYLKLGSWTNESIKGFVLRAQGARQTITGITAGPSASGNATFPYSYTITLAANVTANPGEVEILKPASHPLDGFARHQSAERAPVGIGWNAGDIGVTTGTSNTTTTIYDSTKTWSGAEFAGLTITFPNIFDGAGNRATSTIKGGGVGNITLNTAVSGISAGGGDNYFIGTRHVSCADCHNPHASFKNPEGKVTTLADATHMVDNTHVNIPGWYNDIWKGYLLKVRTAGGAEQIRFINGFDNSTGTYTVSLPWNATPAVGDEYEVLMGDKWTAVGQSGGRAGSGSSGQWGVIPTAWRTPAGYGNMTGASGVRVIDNVFDNVGTTGLGGSPDAGQRDLCVRCHSSFAYRNATPMTPSGGAGTVSSPVVARSTDNMKEFNPANAAHHAVYSRGRNQPIIANGDAAGGPSSYNAYWPAFGAVAGNPYTKSNLGAANDTTKTVKIDSSGVVTFNSQIPSAVLPGWFIYINLAAGGSSPAGTALTQGATKGWFEVVTVNSQNQVTVKPKPSASATYLNTNSYFKLTAGLGNNFVPPYGPWSILRCTDCHGSTKTDPVGPHASVNKWLLKSTDSTLSFDWYDGGVDSNGLPTVVTRTPNTGATAAIFCFNCHRRDVYGDSGSYADTTAYPGNKVAYRAFARAVHAGPTRNHPDGLGLTGMINDDANNILGVGTLKWGDIFCRHCHAGDKVGGIHGTNAVAAQGPNSGKGQGKRFLNGATWNGYNMPTTGVVTCYTQANPNSVSTCAPGAVKSATSSVLYNYTSARY